MYIIPYFLGIPVTITKASPKKEYKTSLSRLLSKVVDNNLLCKIDTPRYELKHCPAAN